MQLATHTNHCKLQWYVTRSQYFENSQRARSEIDFNSGSFRGSLRCKIAKTCHTVATCLATLRKVELVSTFSATRNATKIALREHVTREKFAATLQEKLPRVTWPLGACAMRGGFIHVKLLTRQPLRNLSYCGWAT